MRGNMTANRLLLESKSEDNLRGFLGETTPKPPEHD